MPESPLHRPAPLAGLTAAPGAVLPVILGPVGPAVQGRRLKVEPASAQPVGESNVQLSTFDGFSHNAPVKRAPKHRRPGPRERRLLRPAIAGLEPYVPGRSIEEVAAERGIAPDRIVKLGSNENPLGASPRALAALAAAGPQLHLYPDATARDLREGLERWWRRRVDLGAARIVAGNGMDNVLDTLARLLLQPGDTVIVCPPTFSWYELSARLAGAEPIFVPRRKRDLRVDVHAVLGAVRPSTRIIYLCTPNNPSGDTLTRAEVEALARGTDCLLFLDEAYADFADRTFMAEAGRRRHVVVGRTFSKAWGLAGLRIGYAALPDWLAPAYLKAATPFVVSRAATSAALAALDDDEHLARTLAMVRTGRDRYARELPRLGLRTCPSAANFVAVRTAPRSAAEVCAALAAEGVIVRDCTSFSGAGDDLVRITVGTDEQNSRVLDALARLFPPRA
ncbi:MAG: histidinol-phosphate transaminase [Deltaproteobacteria bacterium]|nr:histidinol-phosphate transaminase [Deltaproteobacteria bacterium]